MPLNIAWAQPYTFTTIAGTPLGFGHADGTGTNATFFEPTDITVDTNGDLYVTDSANECVRKVTTAGVVTTIAGSPRFNGNPNALRIGDGAGNLAVFHSPIGLAIDTAGSAYLADGNNTIRKATPDLTGTNWLVTTLAGNPAPFPPGYVDGTGAMAYFALPGPVAVDSAGRVFVGDQNNRVIRMLTFSVTNWIVSTIAGHPNSIGMTDGTGTNASFQNVPGLALGPASDLFVADYFAIRKVSPSGTNWVVTTIAGQASQQGSRDGVGTNALFGLAVSIAADPNGILYVADYGNDNIRRLTPSGPNYVVTTIAGRAGFAGSADGVGTNAFFFQPQGIAVDANSNVFVSDTFNCTIRKLTPDLTGTNWTVTTIAGQVNNFGVADGAGTNALFFEPTALGVDTNGNVYVCDTGNSLLRKLTPAGPSWGVSTLAGPVQRGNGPNAGAGFNGPQAIAADLNGNLYVADNSVTIRKITASNVTTLAGQVGISGSGQGLPYASQFRRPAGIASDTSGNLYVGDSRNNEIRKVTPSGNTSVFAGQISGGWLDATGTVAMFQQPEGVAIDAHGNLYVADTRNDVIRQITPTAVVTTIAGQPGTIGAADGTGGNAQFGLPEAIAVDAHTNLYVADTGNCTIRQLTYTGSNWSVVTIAGQSANPGYADGPGSAALFNRPHGIAVDTNGIVYVTDSFNQLIRKLTGSGTNWSVSTLAGQPGPASPSRFLTPVALSIDASNNLFVADASDDVIRQLSPAGTNWTLSTIAGLPGNNTSHDGAGTLAGFISPSGLALDSQHKLYVCDSGAQVVKQLTWSGTNWMSVTIAGNAGSKGSADGTNTSARFRSPSGVALDAAGNLYLADTGNQTIRRITRVGTDWVTTTLAGQPGLAGSSDGLGTNALFFQPASVAVDSNGVVYVADVCNCTIRSLSPAGTNWNVSTIAGQPRVQGSADGVGTNALFNCPVGIAVDPDGNLLVSEELNCTVRKLTPDRTGTNWTVSTLGGLPGVVGYSDGVGTNAEFFFPGILGVDTNGFVYLPDAYNQTIRMGQPPLLLQIASAGSGKVALSWPQWASQFLLETTNAVPRPSPWIPLTNGVTISGNRFILTNDIGSPAAFFRLRRPNS